MYIITVLIFLFKDFLICDIEKDSLFVLVRLFSAISKFNSLSEKGSKFDSFFRLKDYDDTVFVSHAFSKSCKALQLIFPFGRPVLIFENLPFQKVLFFTWQSNRTILVENWRCISVNWFNSFLRIVELLSNACIFVTNA
jgi:hypothetical protein